MSVPNHGLTIYGDTATSVDTAILLCVSLQSVQIWFCRPLLWANRVKELQVSNRAKKSRIESSDHKSGDQKVVVPDFRRAALSQHDVREVEIMYFVDELSTATIADHFHVNTSVIEVLLTNQVWQKAA